MSGRWLASIIRLSQCIEKYSKDDRSHETVEWCYRLEQMGNAQNREVLEAETPGMLELYRSYKSVLKPYGMAREQEKKEVSADNIIELLTTIKEATDN